MPDSRTRRQPNVYQRIIERIFEKHYQPGAEEIVFRREEIIATARALRIPVPKNVGDVIYTFRYRAQLPQSMVAKAPPGRSWVIRPAGQGRYRIVAVPPLEIVPNSALAETKVPDATPGVIAMYALGDEQALLARLRYNRLVDIFTGVTCYSLQSHLRTTVAALGQVEVDEIYVGVDRRGAHYVFPVEAKGAGESLGPVQFEQCLAVCEAKFAGLICRPIGAQFMAADLIALFEFEDTPDGLKVVSERHYRLVPPDSLSPEELAQYQARPD
jgi:hypothetical protein